VSLPVYDDAFVFITQDDGVTRVREFVGATHPCQRTSGTSPDVDGDGSPDVGTIRPGRLRALERLLSPPEHPKLWLKFENGDPKVPTWRDTDHDGAVETDEMTVSEQRKSGHQVRAGVGDFATEVLLHPGFSARRANRKPYGSIGCQTAGLADVQAVARYERVQYLLLDAHAVLLALGAATSVA
jgi:hypothetical protein